jgi:hypothetical protein
MPGQFDKVATGQPRKVTAGTWNGILEASQFFQRHKQDARGGPWANEPLNPAVRVLVQNGTGSAIAAGGVLALGTPLISPANYLREASRSPIFPGTTPAAVTDQIAILLDPVDDGDIGRAVIMGVVACSVNVLDVNHIYATPKKNDNTQLNSASSGLGRIVWRETGSSGTKKALVKLDGYFQQSAWKAIPVRFATTTAGTLSTDFCNGKPCDGGTIATGDDVLIKNQADPSENGIYTANASGAPTRRWDSIAVGDLYGGVVYVLEGSYNGDSIWAGTSYGTTWKKVWPAIGTGQEISSTGCTISADTTWTDCSSSSLTVPPGTHLLYMHASGNGAVSVYSGVQVAPYIAARLVDDLGNELLRTIAVGLSGVDPQSNLYYVRGQGAAHRQYTTSASRTVKMQGYRNAATTWTTSQLTASDTGDTRWGFLQFR